MLASISSGLTDVNMHYKLKYQVTIKAVQSENKYNHVVLDQYDSWVCLQNISAMTWLLGNAQIDYEQYLSSSRLFKLFRGNGLYILYKK